MVLTILNPTAVLGECTVKCVDSAFGMVTAYWYIFNYVTTVLHIALAQYFLRLWRM